MAIDLNVENISHSGAAVTFPNGLNTDNITAVGSRTTLNDDTLVLGNLEVGSSPSGLKTVTVYQDLFASRQISAPNMVVGINKQVLYTAFTAASTSETITVAAPVASTGWIPIAAYTKVITPFVASGMSAFVWTLGWDSGTDFSADPDGLLVAGDSDGTIAGFYQRASAHRGAALTSATIYPLGGDNGLTLSATATGANLNTLSAGVLNVVVLFARIPSVF